MGKLGLRPILLPLLSLLSELCLAAFASRNNEEERLPRNRVCHGQAAATNGAEAQITYCLGSMGNVRPPSAEHSLFPK